MTLMRFALGALAAFGLAAAAHAVEPDEVLDDPALEERAMEISNNLRCVVCQSQNINESNAPLAKDMRIVVRERLVEGDSDEAVYDYLVDRYGDYVLLKPRVQGNTILLWIAPGIVLLAAAAGAAIFLMRMKRADDEAQEEPTPGL